MYYPAIKPGMAASLQKVVHEKDAALNFGSGGLTTLLATPTLSALMIEAATKCIDPHLPETHVSIGKSLSITHDHPSTIGMTVTVTAHIDTVDNNRICLTIEAFDEIGHIGTGKHERYLVNKEILMQNVKNRCNPVKNRNF